jgi:hypothetical protein
MAKFVKVSMPNSLKQHRKCDTAIASECSSRDFSRRKVQGGKSELSRFRGGGGGGVRLTSYLDVLTFSCM